MNLLNFDGLEHPNDDFRRKWQGSFVLATAPEIGIYAPSICLLKQFNFPDVLVEFYNKDRDETKEYKTYIHNVNIVKEYPTCGVIESCGDIFVIKRNSHRQWRRGWNEDTLQIEKLTDVNNTNSKLSIIYSGYLPIYRTIDDAITLNVHSALGNGYWLSTSDGFIYKLFYYDTFIGIVTKDKQLFADDETLTLVEMVKHEFQLQ
jgi:hypothetical protein